MNSKIIFFYYKIITLIVFYINNVVNVNIDEIIIFVIFLMSIISFACFTIEYYYQSKNNNANKILYFLLFTNILSSTILFIGMLLKNKNFNGLLYIFFLTIFLIFIFILIKCDSDFKINKNIKFIKNELNAYNSLRLLLEALENSKLNRRNKINLLSYSESKLKLKNHNINDLNFLNTIKSEEFNFYFYLYIEDIFKRLINRFPNSIIIICFYSLFLLEKLQRPSKSYIILCNLFYSNNNNLSNSQNYFIYILIKKIEDNYLNKNTNSYKEISLKLQINYFINLISKICKKYIIFWNLLLDSESKKDINNLNEIGMEINKINEKIKNKIQQFESAKIKNKKIYLLYGSFLRDILNEEEKSKKYLDKSNFYENIENENFFIDRNIDINNITPTSEFQYIVISAKNFNFGIILKISLDICSLFGYTDKELIGKHFNILIPEFIIPDHDRIIKKKLEEEEIENFQNSYKNLNVRSYYFKTSSKFLVEVSFVNGFLYDEDYNPIIFCKINYNNSLRYFDSYHNSCTILTDSQFYIQSMTINSMKLLNLSNTVINGNFEIIIYFKEFNEILTNKLLKHPFKNKEKIKTLILNKKYLNKKEKITWLKNMKNYYIKITEIKILNKLQGYKINFDLINEEELKSNIIGKTIISNKIPKNDSGTNFNNLFGSHTSYNPNRDERDKVENDYFKVLNIHSNNFPTINKDYLPISKNINFDVNEKEFFFENDDSKNKEHESIFKKDFLQNLFNEYNSLMKTDNNNLGGEILIKTKSKKIIRSDDEEENEITSSYSSSIIDNFDQSNKPFLNDDNEINNNDYNNYYKVNVSKCVLFIYNFNNNELYEYLCSIEITSINNIFKIIRNYIAVLNYFYCFIFQVNSNGLKFIKCYNMNNSINDNNDKLLINSYNNNLFSNVKKVCLKIKNQEKSIGFKFDGKLVSEKFIFSIYKSISILSKYKDLSFEEIRYYDNYTNNKKLFGNNNSNNLFGNKNNSNSLFGNNNSKGLFGNNNSNSLFGNNQLKDNNNYINKQNLDDNNNSLFKNNIINTINQKSQGIFGNINNNNNNSLFENNNLNKNNNLNSSLDNKNSSLIEKNNKNNTNSNSLFENKNGSLFGNKAEDNNSFLFKNEHNS